ncbi:MAG TPA: BlaI/MecI/CopY family transcriptional regulator [Bacteroidales bacterium]|nr:BlaI/MecI/CopY family transcriptional regulator [Bacteroidales bacterium]
MKELTKAEEQVMHILWDIKKGFVKDIRDRLPDPKPAVTTVSTIVRILEQKEFVGHKAFGKTHEYYPLVEKKFYTRVMMKGILSKYFSNSYRQLVSFFSQEKGLTVTELEELKRIIDEEIRKQKI